MIVNKNIIIERAAKRPLLADVFYSENEISMPVIVFSHGFKGFKDWGSFDRIAAHYAQHGYAFVKFNFSHNGMSATSTQDFDDLDGFSQNNASRELSDLADVIHWIRSGNAPLLTIHCNIHEIYLIGHSRGGGATILHAASNPAIKKIVTWASVKDYNHIWKNWSEEALKLWEKTGMATTLNGRTQQLMPLSYQLYADYMQNQSGLHILKGAQSLQIPYLICHGTMDDAIPFEDGLELHANAPQSVFFPVPKADHVFGQKHPEASSLIPPDVQRIIDRSLTFFKTGH